MYFDLKYKTVDIKGYEGLYKISNRGDVISVSRSKGFVKSLERIMCPTVKPNKYLDIKLTKNGITKHFMFIDLLLNILSLTLIIYRK